MKNIRISSATFGSKWFLRIQKLQKEVRNYTFVKEMESRGINTNQLYHPVRTLIRFMDV